MDEPLVCCILPYHTPEYFEKAIECFNNQTYENKQLVARNTSAFKISIGVLRNWMIEQTPPGCIIAHWDHDDWSSPTRLQEQVELLTKNNVKVTGYHDLPFHDVEQDRVLFYESGMENYAVGTSLCYWRSVWERTPFPDKSVGEDASWQHAVRREQGHPVFTTSSVSVPCVPRMVARMHSGNTCKKFGNNYTSASEELDRAVRSCINLSIVPQSA